LIALSDFGHVFREFVPDGGKSVWKTDKLLATHFAELVDNYFRATDETGEATRVEAGLWALQPFENYGKAWVMKGFEELETGLKGLTEQTEPPAGTDVMEAEAIKVWKFYLDRAWVYLSGLGMAVFKKVDFRNALGTWKTQYPLTRDVVPHDERSAKLVDMLVVMTNYITADHKSLNGVSVEYWSLDMLRMVLVYFVYGNDGLSEGHIQRAKDNVTKLLVYVMKPEGDRMQISALMVLGNAIFNKVFPLREQILREVADLYLVRQKDLKWNENGNEETAKLMETTKDDALTHVLLGDTCPAPKLEKSEDENK